MSNLFTKLREKMPLWRRVRSQKKADTILKNLPIRSCNRHSNCDMADEQAKTDGKNMIDHCHDEGCEECFGY